MDFYAQQTIRHQFDAYCKKVVKYEMINCYREQERRGKRQVLFSDLLSSGSGGGNCANSTHASYAKSDGGRIIAMTILEL